MRAVITLDDQDGGVGMTLFLEDGFTPTSQAHKAANALVQHLESLSAIQSTGEPQWIAGEDAQWIKGAVTAIPEPQPKTSLAGILTTSAADLQH
jgi:hypothetical protein